MNHLPKLKDIFNEIVVEDNKKEILNENEKEDLIESLLEMLDDYVTQNIKCFHNGSYKDEWVDYLYDCALKLLPNELHEMNIQDELESVIHRTIELYQYVVPRRSYFKTFAKPSISTDEMENLKERVEFVYEKDKQQPPQRTEEWYNVRYNLLSASSIWKALDKENYKNQIIYEKCSPLNTAKYSYVNVNSPFHWGQKYEPISQAYYEHVYNTRIEEFGCIPHSKYNYLGASPDGINVDPDSPRYGRMLEIKNIVNRDITGIPKKEYWIQTQLQMECCNLDECDFLECRFQEYESKEEFDKDGDFQTTQNGDYKGIIVCFQKEGKPYYEYMPFGCTKTAYEKWEQEIMDKNKMYTWVSNIYWRLTEVSCVLIPRNKTWFELVKDELKEVWDTIVKERVTGYQHRKPKSRVKKGQTGRTTSVKNIININLNKLDFSNDAILEKKQDSASKSPDHIKNRLRSNSKEDNSRDPTSTLVKNNEENIKKVNEIMKECTHNKSNIKKLIININTN